VFPPVLLTEWSWGSCFALITLFMSGGSYLPDEEFATDTRPTMMGRVFFCKKYAYVFLTD